MLDLYNPSWRKVLRFLRSFSEEILVFSQDGQSAVSAIFTYVYENIVKEANCDVV